MKDTSSTTSIVCTLFEGDYHCGVAVLINSLYKQGFRGNIYAGYRGNLPYWTKDAIENNLLQWNGAVTLNVNGNLYIHFLPLDTNYHLTNYKPDFMLKLLNKYSCDAICYFDPDIIVNAPWSFFEEWLNCGIAVCEDVNSPLEKFHPRRVAWRNYYLNSQIELTFKSSIYVNGGFVGLLTKYAKFLETWKTAQDLMAPAVNGLNRSKLQGESLPLNASGPFAPFSATDQDALNVAVEASFFDFSFMRKEAMGFASGLCIVPHALGVPKPWNFKLFSYIIKGNPLRLVDKLFWEFTEEPVRIYSSSKVVKMKFIINVCTFLSRFYKKA
ncbi:hypothetical protein P1X15_22430 [Runella sp. MFBS21]|uniref:hypothetical protein n=1 Tax=Runella sp. MFBS21 TaxID=3034018 RepID=UPI0023F73932|nr:hypothetical protein [Runella sp. MFBS21]MDF7820396.1 hypothetical protein [Runella sp. MFBS21]